MYPSIRRTSQGCEAFDGAKQDFLTGLGLSLETSTQLIGVQVHARELSMSIEGTHISEAYMRETAANRPNLQALTPMANSRLQV